MRLKALAEIYTMHSFAQLCNLNFCQKMIIKTLKKKEKKTFCHFDAIAASGNPGLFGALLQPPAPENSKISAIFEQILSIENGAKECIV